MKARFVSSLLATFCLVLWPSLLSAQTNYHFFPMRPAHVHELFSYGVLVSYGAGNDTAGLAIRKANRKLEQFFLASPAIVNGKPFNPYLCRGVKVCPMPHIIFDRTPIRVTFWMQRAPWGGLEKVSNVIDSRWN